MRARTLNIAAVPSIGLHHGGGVEYWAENRKLNRLCRYADDVNDESTAHRWGNARPRASQRRVDDRKHHLAKIKAERLT